MRTRRRTPVWCAALVTGLTGGLAVPPAPVADGSPGRHPQFGWTFAPQDGMVAPSERPAGDELCLNGSWQFQPVPRPAGYTPDTGTAPTLTPPTATGRDAVPIRVPSPWNVKAFPNGAKDVLGLGGDLRCVPSYPRGWDSVDMAWMRRTFNVPPAWRDGGRRLVLHFEAIDGAAQVVANGKPVGGEHFDNFLPFEFDVTDAVRADGDNELPVGVRKAELFDHPGQVGRRPNVGDSMWAESVAGIWQDVYLLSVPAVRVADATAQSDRRPGSETRHCRPPCARDRQRTGWL